MSMEGFPLDASLGSHFFHNVTSMNVGYFSIQQNAGSGFVDWEKINLQRVENETNYFRHIRFDEPLTIIMDGQKRISIITWNNHVPLKNK